MPIPYPQNRQEVIDRINTDVQNELPQANPFIRNSAISAITTGYGGAVYDLNVNQQNLQQELFPNTATDQYAQIWGSMKNITPNAATPASGNVSITGNAATFISAAQIILQSSNGVKYTATEGVNIEEVARNVSTIVRNGSTAIVTTVDNHNLASTDIVTISGADQIEYNITTAINVIDNKNFSYVISGIPATPATGTIFAAATNAIAFVTCQTPGLDTNLSNGSPLFFSSLVPGVNSVSHVLSDGLVGGTDAENIITYRNRYLNAYRNPFAYFNPSSIISFIKQKNYVSRVWVYSITPDVGQVTIYFTVFDQNGFNAIPTPEQVTDVKNSIIDYNTGIKGADRDPNDIFVLAPIPIFVNFDFVSLVPNTESMQVAVTKNLQMSLGENANIATTFPQSEYESAIYQTVDPVTGDSVESFSLITPSGDIPVGAGELVLFGGATF